LRQVGIDVPAGQLDRSLTERLEDFRQEKEELLPTGLALSSYVGVDDTGARQQGQNGSCLLIGSDLFAYFQSSASKGRLNFLQVLRRPHTGYVVNGVAVAYWERQGLAQALVTALAAGATSLVDAAAWNAYLKAVGVTGARRSASPRKGRCWVA
jgi:hypothetical protein